jgi:TPR repeat protein
MRRAFGLLACALLSSAFTGCSRTYHPEYHPENRYSFIQNISVGAPATPSPCAPGKARECWRECFERSRGEACYLLGVMFETGHGVARSHDNAQQMTQLAGRLGYVQAAIDLEMAAPYLDLWSYEHRPAARASSISAPRARPAAGAVTSGGGVVVYGSVNGDIYLAP